MISEKLLSKILNLDDIKEYECRDNECYIVRHDLSLPITNQHILINIYELAHKCKEWAISKGYFIWAGHEGNINLNPQYSAIIGKDKFYHQVEDLKLYTMFHNTEPEAIFKACELILELE